MYVEFYTVAAELVITLKKHLPRACKDEITNINTPRANPSVTISFALICLFKPWCYISVGTYHQFPRLLLVTGRTVYP